MGYLSKAAGNVGHGLSGANLAPESVILIRWKGKHALVVAFLDFENLICDGQPKIWQAHTCRCQCLLSLAISVLCFLFCTLDLRGRSGYTDVGAGAAEHTPNTAVASG